MSEQKPYAVNSDGIPAILPKSTGRVVIAGAGCGDPDLITVKAARYLMKADVVLCDRLVSDEIIRNYVPPTAEVVYVGKQKSNPASMPQKRINSLLLEYATGNRLVVRLKGGDVAFLSNVLDELETLKAHNIPYEIIPGITAASGASACAGIPLTARGYATAVRILTFYDVQAVNDKYWKELAETDETLVLYMSGETLDLVISNLVKHSISPEKKMAIVEQATTDCQRVIIEDVYGFAKKDNQAGFVSPTLFIIGKVVALHEKFAWVPNAQPGNDYFKPLQKDITFLNVS